MKVLHKILGGINLTWLKVIILAVVNQSYLAQGYHFSCSYGNIYGTYQSSAVLVGYVFQGYCHIL